MYREASRQNTPSLCMLGDILLPAFMHLGHECQDLLSPCRGMHNSRVPNQNGVSQACYIVEIHHSGRKPSICAQIGPQFILSSERVFQAMESETIWRVPDQNGVSQA